MAQFLFSSDSNREIMLYHQYHLKTNDRTFIQVTETFGAGRQRALREHIYYSNQTGSEATRIMNFDARFLWLPIIFLDK